MDELIKQLTDAPTDIRQDGMGIVKEETEAAAYEIALAYSRRTGRLARQVRTAFPSTTILYGQVISAAPHSHIYEFGSRQRRTDRGWNRGSMPEQQVTAPIAQRRRTRMMQRLADMLRQRGWQVTED
jgi:hypothetical protein